MKSIMIEDLLKEKNGIIIDIRGEFYYQKSHIPRAISIDEKELYYHPEKYLNMNSIYYIYCFSGHRSSLLTRYLNKIGYHTVHVVGGFRRYLLIP